MNSDDILDSSQSHGIYDLTTFGRLLRIRAAGTWNEQAARRFNKEYKSRITDLKVESWVAYFDLRQWGLAVPEARPFMSELGSWPAPQGTGIHMFLFNGMNIQEALVSSILNVINHDSFFFTTPDEASGWLAKQAFQIDEVEKIMEPITVKL